MLMILYKCLHFSGGNTILSYINKVTQLVRHPDSTKSHDHYTIIICIERNTFLCLDMCYSERDHYSHQYNEV